MEKYTAVHNADSMMQIAEYPSFSHRIHYIKTFFSYSFIFSMDIFKITLTADTSMARVKYSSFSDQALIEMLFEGFDL